MPMNSSRTVAAPVMYSASAGLLRSNLQTTFRVELELTKKCLTYKLLRCNLNTLITGMRGLQSKQLASPFATEQPLALRLLPHPDQTL